MAMAFFRSSLSTDGARAMALAQMMGVVAAAGALAYTPLPPRFSWDTLPVFYHSSNQSGPYNEDAIKNISRFPVSARPRLTTRARRTCVKLLEAEAQGGG